MSRCDRSSSSSCWCCSSTVVVVIVRIMKNFLIDLTIHYKWTEVMNYFTSYSILFIRTKQKNTSHPCIILYQPFGQIFHWPYKVREHTYTRKVETTLAMICNLKSTRHDSVGSLHFLVRKKNGHTDTDKIWK